ncbi:MAG: hypothetical protein EB084_14935 [Proteobacteria bacterium]|nr:hypothetical protein [Pseudomonadota bacterium]
MDRREFIQSAGLVSVALLTGCGGGGSAPSGSPLSVDLNTGSTPVTALLKVNFDVPTVAKSVIPDGTTTLRLQGYDKNGNTVYGPTEVPAPADNLLVVEVPVSMTTFQITGLASAVPV